MPVRVCRSPPGGDRATPVSRRWIPRGSNPVSGEPRARDRLLPVWLSPVGQDNVPVFCWVSTYLVASITDDVEASHEALRAMTLPGEAAWIPAAMRPIAELCPGEHAHLFARGLALAHLDATLRRSAAAAEFLAGDLEAELAARGVEAITHRP